ncbi:calcium-transporting ATPase 4, endoplasmic reticulum-type-like [Dendrobium catenatum]|uniref:calcium-transporting ATPase 4, endoplasmic reticulum-type-like n=1 Tax=Dendrobium catenatum TaxID=906689 RepID=UPI00109EF9CA|nr:calcium-transporting ATPase 4, endoplasmic reticulum-type-like [Dendrobium catenatum]
MVRADTEFGVMGLAFHPNFTKNGHLFVSFNCDKVQVASCSGRYQSVVSEFIANSSSSTPSEATSTVRLVEGSKSLILQAVHEMSMIALRCLGVAYKDDVAYIFNYDGEGHPAHTLLIDSSNYAFIESDLLFAGLVGLRDRPLEEVYQAIENCKAASNRVMAITGNLSQQCLNALTSFNMTLLQSFWDFQKATPEEGNIENKIFDPGICLLQLLCQ